AVLVFATMLVSCNKPSSSAPARLAPTQAPSGSALGTAQGDRRDGEFELVFAGKSYPVTADRPFQIELPGGARAEAVLHRRPVLTYADHGIRFQYPADMRVSVEKDGGVISINVKASDSALAILQIYTIPTSVGLVRGAMIDALKKAMEDGGAQQTSGDGD